jgi:hypothetical protein
MKLYPIKYRGVELPDLTNDELVKARLAFDNADILNPDGGIDYHMEITNQLITEFNRRGLAFPDGRI